MFSMNSGLIRYGRIASDILKDDRSAWQKFWDEYGPITVGISVIVILALIACLIWFLEWYIPKRREKKAQKTTTSDGELIASAKACTVSLVGFQEIILAKGTEFAAPLHEKEGFDFCGWFYDSACTEPYKTTKIHKNITLYPKWVRHD